MARQRGRWRRVFASGHVPLRWVLSLLLLTLAAGVSALLLQHACLKARMGRVVRRTVTRNGYTFLLIHSERFPSATSDRLVECFFTVYPRQAARFNPAAPRSVTLVLESTEGLLETGPVAGKLLRQSDLYLMGHPEQIDVATFNFFRAVQAYPEGRYPAWVCDGLGDYARYTYGVNNPAAGWSLGHYERRQSYMDSYAVTARFFVWLEKRQGGRILEELDAALRSGTYTKDFWTRKTGRSVDQLWAAYAADPAL